jgi:hypothetical protein
MQPEDIMSLPTDPTDEERVIMRDEQAKAEREAMEAVFESYRQQGYLV